MVKWGSSIQICFIDPGPALAPFEHCGAVVMDADWGLDELSMFRFLRSPTSWVSVDCTQSSTRTLNAQQTLETEKWTDRSWPDRPRRGAELMAKNITWRRQLKGKKNQISISLIAQLLIGKKNLPEKIRNMFLIMDNTKNNWNKITVILNQKLIYVWNY